MSDVPNPGEFLADFEKLMNSLNPLAYEDVLKSALANALGISPDQIADVRLHTTPLITPMLVSMDLSDDDGATNIRMDPEVTTLEDLKGLRGIMLNINWKDDPQPLPIASLTTIGNYLIAHIAGYTHVLNNTPCTSTAPYECHHHRLQIKIEAFQLIGRLLTQLPIAPPD